ncbi:MAG: hypothetical protein FWD14_07135 [Treponema sp.]|nr:hypothetical protein [Treponema sp.]
MKKIALILVVLMFFSMGVLFAQENSGYIKPTYFYGVGWEKFGESSTAFTTMGLDLDLVLGNGLTFGLSNTMAWNEHRAISQNLFGIGYTLVKEGWSVGGLITAGPYINLKSETRTTRSGYVAGVIDPENFPVGPDIEDDLIPYYLAITETTSSLEMLALVGFNINFTYWINEKLGVSAAVTNNWLTKYDGSLFALKIGISGKF